MFWVIVFSVWGGFLLGVIFMAVLSMAREEQHATSAGRVRDLPREGEVGAMHG